MVPGDGKYRIQPVAAEDVARIAVEAGHAADDLTIDAVGPETFGFWELVRLIAKTVGSRARVVTAPPWLALLGARAMGLALGDVMLDADELDGLMASLLVSERPPAGASVSASGYRPTRRPWGGATRPRSAVITPRFRRLFSWTLRRPQRPRTSPPAW